MNRDGLIELLAKSAFDHERPDPVSTAPQWSEADEHDRDVYIGAARSQLAALDKAGLAVAPVKPTIAMLDRAMGKHAAYNWQHMLEASAFAAGRIDKEPEGE